MCCEMIVQVFLEFLPHYKKHLRFLYCKRAIYSAKFA